MQQDNVNILAIIQDLIAFDNFVKHNKAALLLSLLCIRCLKENSHIAWCHELDTSLYSFFDKDEICPAMSFIPMGRL